MEGYRTRRRHCLILAWILSAALALAACGGGTGGSGAEFGAPLPGGAPGTGPVPAYATIRLTWNPNNELEIAGYYVYHGTSPGSHSDKVWAGNTTMFDYRIAGAGTHYFAVSAIDVHGNESPKSGEIHFVVP